VVWYKKLFIYLGSRGEGGRKNMKNEKSLSSLAILGINMIPSNIN
jgi:hypothetical protein